ncbi:MAG TPA: hypothetical protein VLB84_20395 [Bacteroidia bacterium]|jgi:hypothetical protein|nr:hypothetical protein [Bacteroidia bacterium]
MEILFENALAISVILTIVGIAFVAFIASPYEVHFEDSDEIDDI